MRDKYYREYESVRGYIYKLISEGINIIVNINQGGILIREGVYITVSERV